ncbi:MAG: hypothetical protein WCO10_00970 [bacterium]
MPTQAEETKSGSGVGVIPASGYHTLLTREIRPPIRNWHEFLALWNAATDHQRQVSLLHEGYTIPYGKWNYDEKEYDAFDRHIFYLTIAEGWADYNLLQLNGDGDAGYHLGYDKFGNKIMKSPKEMRQILALKAFEVLCLNFFKGVVLKVDTRRGREFHGDWEGNILADKFFPVIQNFFRVEKDYRDHIEVRNLSWRDDQSHNEVHAIDFVLNLARFLWGWKEVSNPWWISKDDMGKWREKQNALSTRIISARPWIIEILNHLGRLDLLQEWLLDLDRPCLAKLREIAMRKAFSASREDIPVRNLEEACYLDSKAGWLLKQYELKKAVHQKLQEAERKRQERENGIRRQAELVQAKKVRDEAEQKLKKLVNNK